ncbi:ABC transporter ATP-binding protein [Pseudodesulfovibrio pelocollis]|uniref:ABC transporter ATP-binding protein n=1 Tax=Pseudodesulfovibrio pelocollis TaxID=3051432 RepID=UPI00255B2E9B|nr:ABC transporter ATP-binding protein [Pseudodesulfovibrio sp. SB368]
MTVTAGAASATGAALADGTLGNGLVLGGGAAVEVRGLAKRFGEVQAVRQVDFSVTSGELFGFLGPNGAGKTTTINMLTGLARPDAGSIVIDGIDCVRHPRAAQHLIGVVPDESNLYPEMTGYDNLCFCAALYGMRKAERCERARELLDVFGLAKAADRKFAGYSKGMKRKLTIAAGMIHRPRILFLDEPTTGIDVASARQLRQLIADLHAGGTTVFLTTHYIEEAERLCDRIAFIVAGRIVRVDTVAELVQPVMDKHVVRIACDNGMACGLGDGQGDEEGGIGTRLVAAFPHLRFTLPAGGGIRVEGDGPVRVGPLVRFLEDQGVEVAEARRIRPSLEDVFVTITGIEADAMHGDREKTGGPR